MSYFSKHNVLMWMLAILLIINISAIITMIYNSPGFRCESKPCPRQAPDGMRFIINHLDLNPEQVTEFKKIRDEHRSMKMRTMNDIRNKQDEMFNELTSEKPDTIKMNSIEAELSKLHNALRKDNLKEFTEMKKICNPDQQKKLKFIFMEIFCKRGPGRHFPKSAQ